MRYQDAKKRHKYLLVQLALLTLTIAVVVAITQSTVLNGAIYATRKLKIVKKIKSPVSEISGFTFLKNKSKTIESKLMVVGDKNSRLVSLPIKDSKFTYTSDIFDIRNFGGLITSKYLLCINSFSSGCRQQKRLLTSDWEAVAVDGKNNIFILQEYSGNVFVFDQALSQLRAIIALDFTQYEEKSKNSKNINTESSLGEGIGLLKNGHILVAKEKSPTVIIEYGPKGDKPLGVNSSTILEKDEAFTIKVNEGKATYEPLKAWSFNEKSIGKCDISDLALNMDGKVYALSETCSLVFVINGISIKETHIDFTEIWKLPGKIKKPEAIAVSHKGEIAIGSDRKKNKPNIFLMRLK